MIHRDIKPENFCLGKEQANFDKLYLIDFGLSKIYFQPGVGHIKSVEGKSLLGDLMYASISNHEGKELSRRDDLESSIYMVLYLMTGYLPWASVVFNKSLTLEEKNYKILAMKEEFVDSNFWDRTNVKIKEDSIFTPNE